MLRISLTVLCVVALCSCDNSKWREVKTAQGVVRGRIDPDGGLYTFYGIPYATAPAGADRFKAPLPGPVWLQPLDAVDKGIICMQDPHPLIDLSVKRMQEDCLIANVYVPDTEDKNLPVIVYVHGGAFELGFGEFAVAKQLVKDKKVIVINFNYRLGVLGFLCLGTDDAPGNAGMKDQVALLRWVKKNIRNFGGNPDDVTIIGGSAGSISVDLLMLSKLAKGLFHKVVPESGAGVGSIAVQADPLENARFYAKMLNFTNVDDFYALQEFYKTTPLKTLLITTFFKKTDASIIFSPCVERKTGDRAFLDDTPVNIIKKGAYQKVPILFGFSNMEGLLYTENIETWKNAMNEKFSDFLPADLQFKNEEEKEEVGKKVKEFYFGNQLVGEETILAYVDYYGDVVFTYPTLRSVKLHVDSGHDEIYLYEYSYVDDSTPVVPFTNVRGATHCSQTAAVLDGIAFVTADENSLSNELRQMKNTMRELWSNFVKQGKPVPEGSSLPAWPASGADGSPYMALEQPLKLQTSPLLGDRVRFWNDIYQKYYREPVAPPQPPAKHTEL